MAPEAPGSLVVLDLSVSDEEGWTAVVDRFDPVENGDQWLRVSWSAQHCTGDWQPVAGGVVCALVPPGTFRHETLQADELDDGTGRLQWRDKAPGEGLMLVVVLPESWIVQDASRPPVDAKPFRNRFAAYWLLDGRDLVWWRVTRLEGQGDAELGAIVRQYRAALLDTPSPVFVEDPP